MSKRTNPDYVTGDRGAYYIQPPITHPARCVCKRCMQTRTGDEWNREIVVRIYRKSKYPGRLESAAFARAVKAELEQKLRDALNVAVTEQRALADAVPFGRVCDAYRKHQQDEGKRYDRAKHLIKAVEKFFGRERDAKSIAWADYQRLREHVGKLAAQTQRHYVDMLLAILNYAVAERIIEWHALTNVRRPRVPRPGRPTIWTREEIGVLTGAAMDQFEREQVKQEGSRASSMPLRGLCMVAYFTLMRPKNNFALTWEEITLHESKDEGVFVLDRHKNVNRGILARGPIAPQLARYLRSIRPERASGIVHPNPKTNRAYVDIRKQWVRLVRIAGDMLGYELTGRKADFFTFRHTGASHLGEKNNPVLITKMMGDTSIRTVMAHYCDPDVFAMKEIVADWTLPVVEIERREERDERPN
jgi:hypothetical protein